LQLRIDELGRDREIQRQIRRENEDLKRRLGEE
jgi:hypothetical protein